MLTELLLTEKEASAALKVSLSTLLRLRNAGEIPYLRIGAQIRYPADDLRRWIRDKCQGGQRG